MLNSRLLFRLRGRSPHLQRLQCRRVPQLPQADGGLSNVPNDRCSIGGCKLPHGGGSPVELRTGGVRIELAACVVQACAGEGCHQTGTWSELRAHSPWCVAAEVNCPFCEEPLKRADLKKHLTEHHGAPLVETTRSTESPSSNDSSSDSDSDSSDSDSARRRDGTVTIGVWEIDVRRAPLSVAIVVGRCKQFHHCIGGEAPAQCACPFVIATARTCFYDDIPTTHVSVFTVFTEVTALRHPMGHCEVSMHATDKSPCGALVSSRCARAYPVLARCDGGPRFAMTDGLSGLRKAGSECSTRGAEGGLPVHYDFSEHKKAGYEVRFNPLEPSERGCRFASFKNPSERACFNGLCVIAQLALSTNLALIK